MRNSLWLSAILLLLANLSFGLFLHDLDSSETTWILTLVYVVFECGALSIAWKRVRNFALLGFQSDVGYAFIALAGASFAVVILAWARISSHFLAMLAAALLMRVSLFTSRIGVKRSFCLLLLVSVLGLSLSWVPILKAIAN